MTIRVLKPARWLPLAMALALSVAPLAHAAEAVADPAASPGKATKSKGSRNGLEIYQRFRDHLAEPDCRNASPRWSAHYAHATRRMAASNDELLPLFGYVVDELIKAKLPTEYALIPFIESGYKPAARSKAGPAGLWQFIAVTARNQGIPMRTGYDGRYSVVDSTQAAVRYLKILHGMFGRNWRVAIMGYNAGEYRLINAIKRSGMGQRNAEASRIQGMPLHTRAYVEKLHALACLLEDAGERESWRKSLDRSVPLLGVEQMAPAEARTLDAWARARKVDPGWVRRLNPALASGSLRGGAGSPQVLAPASVEPATQGATDVLGVMVDVAAAAARAAPRVTTASSIDNPLEATAAAIDGRTNADAEATPATPTTHVVAKGDSWWTIARRYRTSTAELLRINGLAANAPLRPGMVLKLDAGTR